jgi:hypothetical protein
LNLLDFSKQGSLSEKGPGADQQRLLTQSEENQQPDKPRDKKPDQKAHGYGSPRLASFRGV